MTATKIKRMGILSSGGDASGINPCIRAAVRTAITMGVEVIGIQEGFDGLIRGEMSELRTRDVGGILQRGGTFLRTARCPEFKTKKGQREALRELNESEIDGLIVIGGDGSMHGAHALAAYDFPVIGAPASIDNDIYGTEMSIGVDTALNTIMEAVDKLRDTASSHQRAFLVETMGRGCGYLALQVGIVCGAEMIIVPEEEATIDEVAEVLENAYSRGKNSAIVVVAEGAKLKCSEIAAELNARDIGFETRVTILGHVPRGGSPTAFDRMLASRLGVRAVELLLEGKTDVMVGLQDGAIVGTPLEEVISRKQSPNPRYFEIARMISR
jgi:6-phosphofructokinase 1